VQPIELGGPQPDHPAIQEISPSDMAPGPLTVPAGK
jgi:hypothetical protein